MGSIHWIFHDTWFLNGNVYGEWISIVHRTGFVNVNSNFTFCPSLYFNNSPTKTQSNICIHRCCTFSFETHIERLKIQWHPLLSAHRPGVTSHKRALVPSFYFADAMFIFFVDEIYGRRTPIGRIRLLRFAARNFFVSFTFTQHSLYIGSTSILVSGKAEICSCPQSPVLGSVLDITVYTPRPICGYVVALVHRYRRCGSFEVQKYNISSMSISDNILCGQHHFS